MPARVGNALKETTRAVSKPVEDDMFTDLGQSCKCPCVAVEKPTRILGRNNFRPPLAVDILS